MTLFELLSPVAVSIRFALLGRCFQVRHNSLAFTLSIAVSVTVLCLSGSRLEV